jgi:DNA-binding winged helix-turn-helix (wHTH) protein/TolB-like protein
MDTEARQRLEFLGYVLDLDRCVLLAPDGRPVALTGRPYDVLTHLILNARRVVTKDELFAAAWPGLVVEENNLSQAVSALRRVLNDSRDAPRFILTVPGRGYRFVADVRALPPATADDAVAAVVAMPDAGTPRSAAPWTAAPQPEPAPAEKPRGGVPRRVLLGGALAAATLGTSLAYVLGRRAEGVADAPLHSLAVLPLRPLDGHPANPALEQGIAESMIIRLSDLPGLAVAPSSSVRRAMIRDSDPLVVGRALAVAAVLDGQLQADEGAMRLTARLLEVPTGRTIWAGQFDETHQRTLLDLQDALAARVIAAMRLELAPTLRARVDKRHTRDPEAWKLYLNGRYQWEQKTEPALRKAIEFFAAAQSRDPHFALPAAGSSDAWSRLAVYGIAPPGEVLPQASRAAERAVALDPELAEAQTSLGHVLAQHDRNWPEAERHLRRGIELRPSFANAYLTLAWTLLYRGELDAALQSVETARGLEPAATSPAMAIGLVRYYRREYRAAEEHLRSLLAGAPGTHIARHYLARVLTMSGRPDEAVALLERGVVPAPAGRADLGRAYAMAGRVADAQREIAALEDLGTRGFGIGYETALVEAALGRRARALDALERAVADQSQLVGMVQSEPALDPVRDDPRFAAVVRSLRLGA